MRKETINYLELGIKSYTEKAFSKYKTDNSIIYSQNFENDFINPNLVNLIQLYKNMIEKNKISKLWNCVADSIKEYTYPLFDIFEKEMNSLNKKDISKNIIYDSELAGINLNKFKSISIACYLCIKGSLDVNKNIYNISNEDIQKFKMSLDWLYNFCLIKDNINIYSSYLINFIIKIPIWINSLYSDFNEKYLKWLIDFFSEKKQEKNLYEPIITEIKNIINNSKKESCNNAFTILKKSQKNNKFSRSRGTSFDKSESVQNNTGYEHFNIQKSEGNRKIENYFKVISKNKKNEKDEKKENDLLIINKIQNYSLPEIDIFDNNSMSPSQIQYHYSFTSDISFEGNSQSCGIGINSLLKVNHSSSFKTYGEDPFYKSTLSYKKDYSNCKKACILLKLTNNENINLNNVECIEKVDEKKEKSKSINQLVNGNFYDSQRHKKNKYNQSTNDKTKKKKSQSKNEVIAFKTPVKSNSIKELNIDTLKIRKNLANLFQQNNN